MLFMCLGLSRLVSVSFTEDVFGVVQKVLIRTISNNCTYVDSSTVSCKRTSGLRTTSLYSWRLSTLYTTTTTSG